MKYFSLACAPWYSSFYTTNSSMRNHRATTRITSNDYNFSNFHFSSVLSILHATFRRSLIRSLRNTHLYREYTVRICVTCIYLYIYTYIYRFSRNGWKSNFIRFYPIPFNERKNLFIRNNEMENRSYIFSMWTQNINSLLVVKRF